MMKSSPADTGVGGPADPGVTRRTRPRDASSTAGDTPAVVVEDLDVTRGRTPILHDISLTIPSGSIVGLLGPSGCGKTTLMRTIVGVQTPAAGDVTVLGLPAGSRALRGRIGYVTQQVSAYMDLSVRDNVGYFASLFGAPRSSVADVIEAVGLGAQARQAVGTLSGGEASRASLACALVGDPELLVLDEPTVGLDPLTREDLWRGFHDHAASGHTLLISSHVMDEATRCDSLVLMRAGRVLASLTPAELLARTGTTDPDEAFLTLIRRSVGEPAAPGGEGPDGGAALVDGEPRTPPAPTPTTEEQR